MDKNLSRNCSIHFHLSTATTSNTFTLDTSFHLLSKLMYICRQWNVNLVTCTEVTQLGWSAKNYHENASCSFTFLTPVTFTLGQGQQVWLSAAYMCKLWRILFTFTRHKPVLRCWNVRHDRYSLLYRTDDFSCELKGHLNSFILRYYLW